MYLNQLIKSLFLQLVYMESAKDPWKSQILLKRQWDRTTLSYKKDFHKFEVLQMLQLTIMMGVLVVIQTVEANFHLE